MTAPSSKVRGHTYLRDGHRCISCGSRGNLSWQHREAVGMGGAGSKRTPVTTADGVTLCLPCNEACEAEGQERALALGWKIRRFRGGIQAAQIPFYDRNDRTWYLPGPLYSKSVCLPAIAAELLEAAGNLRPGLAT